MQFFKKHLSIIKALSNSKFLVRQNIRNFIVKNMKDKQFDVVVDIGAGNAPYKQFIKHEKYICLDSENRGKFENDFYIIDANKDLPFEEGMADLVILTEVLEHLKEPQKILFEANRILKKDGYLILTTPFAWPLHEAPIDYFRYTKYGLLYLLEKANFTDIKISPRGNYLFALCQLFTRLLSKKIYRPLVFVLNIIGIFLNKISKNNELTLGYNVIANK